MPQITRAGREFVTPAAEYSKHITSISTAYRSRTDASFIGMFPDATSPRWTTTYPHIIAVRLVALRLKGYRPPRTVNLVEDAGRRNSVVYRCSGMAD
jgi:hypothetical protein